jgi:hypothetical protein
MTKQAEMISPKSLFLHVCFQNGHKAHDLYATMMKSVRCSKVAFMTVMAFAILAIVASHRSLLLAFQYSAKFVPCALSEIKEEQRDDTHEAPSELAQQPPLSKPTYYQPVNHNGMVSISPKSVTIVTAFFPLEKSKHTKQQYESWIRRFLKLQDNMVVFCPPEWVRRIQMMRSWNNSRLPIHIVPMFLNETRIFQEYKDDRNVWKVQHSRDPERETHKDPMLYVIWNEKASWVQKAIEIDPFSSDFFAWVDIGYMRSDLLLHKRMIRFLPQSLRQDQVLLLNVKPFININHLKGRLKNATLYTGGGFIGGSKLGLTTWAQKYYALLKNNIQSNFIGKEQEWMTILCMQEQKHDLCHTVDANSRDYRPQDPWFYMAPYLHQPKFNGTLPE